MKNYSKLVIVRSCGAGVELTELVLRKCLDMMNYHYIIQGVLTEIGVLDLCGRSIN